MRACEDSLTPTSSMFNLASRSQILVCPKGEALLWLSRKSHDGSNADQCLGLTGAWDGITGKAIMNATTYQIGSTGCCSTTHIICIEDCRCRKRALGEEIGLELT